jgi:hypothetical protein
MALNVHRSFKNEIHQLCLPYVLVGVDRHCTTLHRSIPIPRSRSHETSKEAAIEPIDTIILSN